MNTHKILVIALVICLKGNFVNAQNNIPQDDLITYYPFNEDFNDKSGNNYNGRVNGAVLTGTKNKACYFDGINDYIEVAGVGPLKTVKQLTISCWIKPFTTKSYDSWISKANDNLRNSQWRLDVGSSPENKVELTIYNGNWKGYSSEFQFEMDKWYHVLYLIDNTNHKVSIYIDGKNVKSLDISELSTSDGPLLIGCQKDNGLFFNGLIDEVIIYTRLLNTGEIEILYNNFKNSEKAELDPMLAGAIQRAEYLQTATAAGDLNKVRTLIEADSTLLESKDNRGNTPLLKACLSRQLLVAKYLIDKGANVNARNNSGYTPLLYASSSQGQDVDLIQSLIARGADVNAQLERGLSALHFTAFSGNLKGGKLLIDNGADLNAYDMDCYGTVLHSAINLSPNDEMAKLLIESGAELNQKFSFGNTELHLATMKGYTDLVRILVRHGIDVNAVNAYNHTALYYAAKHGYHNTADALIAAGAKENTIVETNYGKSPQLSAALKEGEAWLWYLGGLYGGGYAVKTKQHLLIFDKTEIDESLEAGLANGHLNPNELAGQKITVFITKVFGMNNEPRPFELAKQIPGVDLIVDSRPTPGSAGNSDIPPYRLAVPNESFSVGGIQVHTIPAIGHGYGGAEGLGYLVEVDGMKIFHAGFHASGNGAAQMERYRKEIDFLKPFGPIDIAILPVSGHLNAAYEPYLYLIDQLSPKAIYLMCGDQVTEEYPRCVEVLHARNIPVKYPEGGIANGERFQYLRDSIQK